MIRLPVSLRKTRPSERRGREVAGVKSVILVPPWVGRTSGLRPMMPAVMMMFCMASTSCFPSLEASLRQDPEKACRLRRARETERG
jgi:hypothetical protein